MRILLDSHVFVWFVLGDPQCRPKARELIGREDATVFVSVVTAWEMATKFRLGKWPEVGAFVSDLPAIIVRHDFSALPISIEHGRTAGLMQNPHKDPFDRMLVAQSKVESMPLVTADRRLGSFGIETVW